MAEETDGQPTVRATSPCACGAATRPGASSPTTQMPAQEGEVVLDVIHRVQATQAPDLACRWNCKAGKCGSCSAEINGRPVPDVHDPDGHASGRPGGDGGADAGVPHPP